MKMKNSQMTVLSEFSLLIGNEIYRAGDKILYMGKTYKIKWFYDTVFYKFPHTYAVSLNNRKAVEIDAPWKYEKLFA